MQSGLTGRRDRQKLALIIAVAAASIFSTALLQLRLQIAPPWRYEFLQWNLFLAWIPLACAVGAVALSRTSVLRPFALALGLGWLLFLPNAPYLATDIIHIGRSADVPRWFDMTLLGSFAVTGVLIGLVSLLLMQDLVAGLVGRLAGRLFAGGVLALAAFGVYLGRFERLNSWDLLLNPMRLVAGAMRQSHHPAVVVPAAGFTIMFFAFLVASYYGLLLLNARLLHTGRTNS